MVIKQYEIFIICLDPAFHHEIKKIRPCVVISPDEMNKNISTIMIAPITSKSHKYPTRVSAKIQNREGWIVLDQIRTVDKKRIIKRLGRLDAKTIREIKSVIKEMLVD